MGYTQFEIFAAVMDFYSSGQPLFLDSQAAAAAKDTPINEVKASTFIELQLRVIVWCV